MKATSQRLGLVMVLAAVLVTTTGCQSTRLRKERDALYTQNQTLQERLTQAQMALDTGFAEREQLVSEINRLSAQLEAKNSQPTPAPAKNGFEGIDDIETIRQPGALVVRVPGDVLFEPGKITLRKESLATLDKIVSVIRKEYPASTIRVVGYTDTDPIRKSNWADNLDLSLERAAAVHRHLQKGGLDPKRLDAVGRGEWHPRDTKAKSRRVEIEVVLTK